MHHSRDHRSLCYEQSHSIFLVPVRLVDEPPVEFLGLLTVKLLAAIGACKLRFHLDANVGHRTITRLGRSADLHRLWHFLDALACGKYWRLPRQWLQGGEEEVHK